MPLLKVIWWLIMLLPRIFWFLVKCMVRIISFGQYNPWKRPAMQQLEDLSCYSVEFYSKERTRLDGSPQDKQVIKAAIHDAKHIFKFNKKHSKWPRWFDKGLLDDCPQLGISGDKSRFLNAIKNNLQRYSVGVQMGKMLICDPDDLKKLEEKLLVTNVNWSKQDFIHGALKKYGDAFYNACATSGVKLTRFNCSCKVRSVDLDFSTDCCTETLSYSDKAKKKIIKAMALTLKKKQYCKERVAFEGGEVPEKPVREPVCDDCDETEAECECEKFVSSNDEDI